MLLRVEAVKTVGAQENVGLPLQGLAKRVAALRDDIVKDTARGEDVHRVGLKRNTQCERCRVHTSLAAREGKSTVATLARKGSWEVS